MLLQAILNLFLYFPEDKSEYGPAFVTSVIFVIFAVLAMRFFINHSKKEQKKAEELEKSILNEKEKHFTK
ncbi:hypothetical protein ACLM5H_03965 [Fredinandcohnia humi]